MLSNFKMKLYVQFCSGNVKERYKKLIERVYDSEGRGCRHVFDGAGDTDEDCCLTFDSAGVWWAVSL